MHFRIRLIFLFLIGFGIAYSSNINIQNGLSNNFVHTIFKDSKGIMWFGTETGLDSYDGLQTISYAKRFKTPLKGAIQSLVELKEGVFLVGTSWGAFRYNIKKNDFETIDFGILGIDVRSIYKSTSGSIYCATDRGLFLLNPVNLRTTFFSLNKAQEPSLVFIAEDKNKNVFVIGKNSLYRIPANKKQVQSIAFHLTSKIKTACLIKDVIYLASESGLFTYDINKGNFKEVKELLNTTVLSLAYDGITNLYIGTDNDGLYQLNTKTFSTQQYKRNLTPESISSNTIHSLFFDNSNVLWIGTFDSGIDYWNLQKEKKFNVINFLGNANPNIRSIYFTPTGEKYIGSRDGFLYCLDTKNNIKKSISTATLGIRSKILTTIFPFPGQPDLLLIGTFGGGITVLNKRTYQCSNFSNDSIFQHGSIYKFCSDKANNLWIATLDGLYKYSIKYKFSNRLITAPITGSNEIFALAADAKNTIWIGTKTGLCYYNTLTHKLIQPTACKPYRFQCTSVYVDTKQNTWACFNKGGVLKLDKNGNQKLWLSSEIDLPENAPSSLIEDNEGSIWIGSSKGLYMVNQNNEIQAFGIEDGLNSLGFCPESVTKDIYGKLWWSNDKGLVTYINDYSSRNLIVPTIKFTDLFINGTKYDSDTLSFITQPSSLKYLVSIKGKSNNNLEFRVVALNFKNAHKNRYRYFLEGVDTCWSKPTANNIISYNKLNPGSYTLKIKASNNDGIWTQIPTEIVFSISPYFYETVWFIILIWMGIIGVVLYFTRTYIVRMKQKIVIQLEELKKKQTTGGSSTLKVSEEKGNEIKDRLFEYMQNEKPFLNSELRQAEVAKSTGFSIHEISQVLNTQLNQSFPDFVNSFRIEEVKIRIQNGDTKKYTLTAIAMQCGFNAKSSFLRAFKKGTGMTPSEYFKGVKVD